VHTIEAAHNPEVAGSNPAPATREGPGNGAFPMTALSDAGMRRPGALPPAPALWPPALNATDERHGSAVSLGQCLGLGGVPFDPPISRKRAPPVSRSYLPRSAK
jgi:hypothetical protein